MSVPVDLTKVQAFALTETQAALAKPTANHLSIIGYGTSMTVCGVDALRALRDAVDCAIGSAVTDGKPGHAKELAPTGDEKGRVGC